MRRLFTVPVIAGLAASAALGCGGAAHAAGLTVGFDGGDPASLGAGLADSVTVSLVSSGGGRLDQTTSWDRSATALATPAFNGSVEAPRAVLAISNRDADVLSPGSGRLVFGADVRLDAVSAEPGSADNGDNVVQRGLFAGPQYKIQVDHRIPSCRIAGAAGEATVSSTARLEPDTWYRMRCVRDGDTVTLRVSTMAADGKTRVATDSVTAPTGSLDFAAGVPLSVGGKLNADGGIVVNATDQFNGAIDHVMLRIG